MFITFNTIKQAENYLKRHPNHSFTDGCGCCGNETSYSIKGNKVIRFALYKYAGVNTTICTVVGKIKPKVEISTL